MCLIAKKKYYDFSYLSSVDKVGTFGTVPRSFYTDSSPQRNVVHCSNEPEHNNMVIAIIHSTFVAHSIVIYDHVV